MADSLKAVLQDFGLHGALCGIGDLLELAAAARSEDRAWGHDAILGRAQVLEDPTFRVSLLAGGDLCQDPLAGDRVLEEQDKPLMTRQATSVVDQFFDRDGDGLVRVRPRRHEGKSPMP